MMFDCNFRQEAEEDNDEMYDVLGDLLDNELTTKKCGLKPIKVSSCSVACMLNTSFVFSVFK